MDSVQMPDDYCPHCGHLLTDLVDIDKPDTHPPIEGDVTICLFCSTILRFKADLKVRKLTEEEFRSFSIEFILHLAKAKLWAIEIIEEKEKREKEIRRKASLN